MTESDVADKELFVSLSDIGADEPHPAGTARGALARLYNDLPGTGIFIARKADGKYRSVSTLDAHATSDDFWTTDELFISTVIGFKHRIVFHSGGGFTVRYQKKVSLAPGTNNVGRFFRLHPAATDAAEIAHAGDGVSGR